MNKIVQVLFYTWYSTYKIVLRVMGNTQIKYI